MRERYPVKAAKASRIQAAAAGRFASRPDAIDDRVRTRFPAMDLRLSTTANLTADSITARNSAIDVLRGLSILLVILHHLGLPFRLPLKAGPMAEVLSPRLIDALSYNGYSAVYAFFVISGFLIAKRTLERNGSFGAIDLRRFYVYRASRIAPLLLALLLVLVVMHLIGVPGYVIDQPGQSLGGALLSALGLYLNWYEGQTSWLPANWDVLWSLSIEELFYLLFPLLCWCLPRPWLLLGLAVLVVSLPWTRGALDGQEIWQEKAYLPAMSAIAMGVLAATLLRVATPSRAFARCLGALGLIGLLLSMLCGGELWRALQHNSLLVLAVSVALLLLGCAWAGSGAPRGLHWLASMGRLSYELYLTHMFVVLAVLGLYRQIFGSDNYWSFLAYAPTIVGCVLLAGWLERRFCKPSERILRARFAPRVSSGVAA
jgi:peptidoglycan/LPS O-acetylase OafA/YrhL